MTKLPTFLSTGIAIARDQNIKYHLYPNMFSMMSRFGNGGKGSVVGLLKVGRKKLFLLDEVRN